MKQIGILGGTFNPPHIGHLWIAEEARIRQQLDEVWFIPTRTPPHKETEVLNAVHRVQMLQLAIQDNPYFRLNTMELDREGKSYTFDTIKILTDKHPDISFSFIVGGDMVEYLPNWYRIDELMEMISFIGVTRPGYSLETTYPVTSIETQPLDISSTFLRNRLKAGQEIRYLLPSSVMDYIKENRIYEFR